MLHITNGQSVGIQHTGLPGEVVCWEDVLHEGPVPAGLTLEQMSEVRARFIAGCGWGAFEDVWAGFKRRDASLARLRDHEEVVLWFEHDLYDQLQIIQILDWLLTHDRANVTLSLICISQFPGIGRFTGLGQLTAEQLFSLFGQRQPITLDHLRPAATAWAAFCSPDPADIEWVIGRPPAGLPFLKGALTRHLEQFPSVANGLSRSERQILEVLATGLCRFEEIFLASQDLEERVFMGDATFRQYLDRMAECPAPLIEIGADALRVTPLGRKVWAGAEDAVRLNGIDRWLGGVHLEGREAEWRWDEREKRLRRAHRD